MLTFIFFDNIQYNFIRYAGKTIIHLLPVKTGKSGSRVIVYGGNEALYQKPVYVCYRITSKPRGGGGNILILHEISGAIFYAITIII